MVRSHEEILADVAMTLDQLIHNATAMNGISCDTLFTREIEALQKTQESLLARLIHMNDLLDPQEKRDCYEKRPSALATIENKIAQFGQLNGELINLVKEDIKLAKTRDSNRRPKIRKNRKRIKVPL